MKNKFILFSKEQNIKNNYAPIIKTGKSKRKSNIDNLIVFTTSYNKNYYNIWYSFELNKNEIVLITHNSIYNSKQIWYKLPTIKNILTKMTKPKKKLFLEILFMFAKFNNLQVFVSNLIFEKISYQDIVSIYNILYEINLIRDDSKHIKKNIIIKQNLNKIKKLWKYGLTPENILLFTVYFNNFVDVLLKLKIKTNINITATFLDLLELNIIIAHKISETDNDIVYKT